MTGVAAATTLVTMSLASTLSNVTLNLTSTANVALTGVLFPDGTTASAQLFNVNITVTNVGATGPTATIVGVLVQSTGDPPEFFANVIDCIIIVTPDPSTTGTARGILMNTSTGVFRALNSTANANSTGTTGSNVGVEINITDGTLTFMGGAASGSTFDVSQTAGFMFLGPLHVGDSTISGQPIGQQFIQTQSVNSTATITTTSTTDVVATGMTIVASGIAAGSTGTYVIMFSGTVHNSAAGNVIFMSIYNNGVQIASSQAEVTEPVALANIPFCCTAVAGVLDGNDITGEWHVSAGTGTMFNFTLTAIRVL